MLGDDFINQHICLFLAGSQLDEKKQREFFYRMCTALGYDDEKMAKLSKIYSIYGLFGSKPLLNEDIATLKRLSPCKGCSALRRKAIYKNMELHEKACPMCLFSENFQNAREHDEIVVLRHLMKPDSQYEYYQILSENAFTSLSRLCSDYAMGDYPIIPFMLYLYRFLEKHRFAEYEEEQFFNELLQFIMSQMDTVINIEEYREPLQTLFNTVAKIDEHAINQDIYELSANKLRKQYKYTPPVQTVKPDQCGTVGKKPRQRRRTVRQNEPKNQASIFKLADISIQAGQDTETCTDTPAEPSSLPDRQSFMPGGNASHECMKEEKQEKSQALVPGQATSALPETNSGAERLETSSACNTMDAPSSKDEEKYCIPKDEDDIGMPDISEIPEPANMSEPISDSGNNPSISGLSGLEGKSDTIINNKTNIKHDKTETKQSWFSHAFKNMAELYTCSTFSNQFMQKITYVERKNSFEFIAMLEKNYNISMEPALLHDRKGILLYLPAQDKFFFYDIAIFGTEMLTMYLARPSIFTISYNSMGILGILTEGFNCPDYIWGMDAAEWALNPSRPMDFPHIIEDNANASYKSSDIPDALAFAMPLYRKIYFSEKRRLEESNCMQNYGKTMRLLGVLSKSLRLGEIFYAHKPFFTGTAFMHYEFHFDWSDIPNKAGQIFRISVPIDMKLQDGIRLDSFLADVLLCFCGLHHSNETRVYLISISSKAIYYFFGGSYDQSMHFYDSIIARIQKRYLARYVKPINTSSTFISYK